MLTEHLELFVRAARIESLTRAAEEVAITQPTASRWLRALEAETGGRLLERSSQGVRLTPLGLTFLPYAERSVRAVREGLTSVRDLRSGRAGTLAVGCAEVTSTYFLPTALRGFRRVHPAADLRVRTAPSGDITTAVVNGELEIGFVTNVDDRRVESLLLQADAYVFVVRAEDDLPVSKAGWPLLRALVDRDLIVYGSGQPFPQLGPGPFLTVGLAPRVAMEVDSVETAKRMVLEGFGIALLPRMAVAEELENRKLMAIEPEGVALGHWHVRMVRPMNRPLTALAASFWEWCTKNLGVVHPHH